MLHFACTGPAASAVRVGLTVELRRDCRCPGLTCASVTYSAAHGGCSHCNILGAASTLVGLTDFYSLLFSIPEVMTYWNQFVNDI